MAIEVIRVIVLPPLMADTKFAVSSGLLQMLQNHGLFAGLPSEDPHSHLHNVAFVCKSEMGTQNLSMDIVGLRVFLLSLQAMQHYGYLSSRRVQSPVGQTCRRPFWRGTSQDQRSSS